MKRQLLIILTVIGLALITGCTSTKSAVQPHSAPQGWQAITYYEVAFAVPSDWTVESAGPQDTGCDALLNQKVILGAPGNYQGCEVSSSDNPGLGVRVTATASPATTIFPEKHTATTVNGIPADLFTNSPSYAELTLPNSSVRFSFNGLDEATRSQIIATIQAK